MNSLLLILQWVVSLIAVFEGIGLTNYMAMKEDWRLVVACLPFPPFLP